MTQIHSFSCANPLDQSSYKRPYSIDISDVPVQLTDLYLDTIASKPRSTSIVTTLDPLDPPQVEAESQPSPSPSPSPCIVSKSSISSTLSSNSTATAYSDCTYSSSSTTSNPLHGISKNIANLTDIPSIPPVHSYSPISTGASSDTNLSPTNSCITSSTFDDYFDLISPPSPALIPPPVPPSPTILSIIDAYSDSPTASSFLVHSSFSHNSNNNNNLKILKKNHHIQTVNPPCTFPISAVNPPNSTSPFPKFTVKRRPLSTTIYDMSSAKTTIGINNNINGMSTGNGAVSSASTVRNQGLNPSHISVSLSNSSGDANAMNSKTPKKKQGFFRRLFGIHSSTTTTPTNTNSFITTTAISPTASAVETAKSLDGLGLNTNGEPLPGLSYQSNITTKQLSPARPIANQIFEPDDELTSSTFAPSTPDRLINGHYNPNGLNTTHLQTVQGSPKNLDLELGADHFSQDSLTPRSFHTPHKHSESFTSSSKVSTTPTIGIDTAPNSKQSPFNLLSSPSIDLQHDEHLPAPVIAPRTSSVQPDLVAFHTSNNNGANPNALNNAVNAVSGLTRAAQKTANELYNGVYTVIPQDEYARWLGDNDDDRLLVRQIYMRIFEWTGKSILASLRDLCNKLYLKGESQQLNRILESFSQAWTEKNPNHGFYSSSVVYTVAYALVLLNTDLFAAEHSNIKKMSKSKFVSNTLETIRGHTEKEMAKNQANARNVNVNGGSTVKQTSTPELLLINDSSFVTVPSKEWEYVLESILKSFYVSVAKEPLKLNLIDSSSSTSSGPNLVPSVSVMSNSSLGNSSSSNSSSIFGRLALGRLRANRNFDSFNQSRIADRSLDRSLEGFRRDSFGSTFSLDSNFSSLGINRHAIGFAGLLWSSMIKEETDDPSKAAGSASNGHDENFADFDKIERELAKEVELELLGAPWAKEGILLYRPYIDPNTGKRNKKKDWTQVFVVVQRGQLKIFKFGGNVSNGSVTNGVVGGGNWMEKANMVDGFHLCHVMAQELPPPKKTRGYSALWSLTLPQRGLLVFQAGTPEIAKEYVYTCNYWAGRLSKEPFDEPVSSMEFGWGITPAAENTDDDESSSLKKPGVTPSFSSSSSGKSSNNALPGDKIEIKEWRPSGHSMIVSDLNEETQFENLKAYIETAEANLAKHNALRQRLTGSFTAGTVNWTRAHSNWEHKSQFLLQQLIRYKIYVDSLDQAIKDKLAKTGSEIRATPASEYSLDDYAPPNV